MWRRVMESMLVGLLVLAEQVLAALGIEAPVEEIGAEFWGTVIPVATTLVGVAMVITAYFIQHAVLFYSLLVLAVVIFSIGLGVPTMISGAGLNWLF